MLISELLRSEGLFRAKFHAEDKLPLMILDLLEIFCRNMVIPTEKTPFMLETCAFLQKMQSSAEWGALAETTEELVWEHKEIERLQDVHILNSG